MNTGRAGLGNSRIRFMVGDLELNRGVAMIDRLALYPEQI